MDKNIENEESIDTFYDTLVMQDIDEESDFIAENREIPKCDDLKKCKLEDIEGYSINFENPEISSFVRRIYDRDTNLISLYGPKNPYVPIDGFRKKCPTSINGECRMMTCNCEENIDETHTDWFTHTCSHCDCEIENKCQAIRIPFLDGSFKHCFCSSDCAHGFYSFDMELVEHAFIEIIRVMTHAFPIKRQKTLVIKKEEDHLDISHLQEINLTSRKVYISNIFEKLNIPDTHLSDYSDGEDSNFSGNYHSDHSGEDFEEESESEDCDDFDGLSEYIKLINENTNTETFNEDSDSNDEI